MPRNCLRSFFFSSTSEVDWPIRQEFVQVDKPVRSNCIGLLDLNLHAEELLEEFLLLVDQRPRQLQPRERKHDLSRESERGWVRERERERERAEGYGPGPQP